jgi:outer membrane protein TolC
MLKRYIFLIIILFFFSLSVHAQQPNAVNNNYAPSDAKNNNENTEVLTLTECLKYALKNQPALNQSIIDEAIARANNAIAFSAWMPQLTGAANYQHYFQLPTVFSTINGTLTPVQSGVYNTSIPSVTATQTLFSPDVLLAVRAAKLNILEAKQNTKGTKIEVVAGVSKAFYDLLLSIQQVAVYREDTARLIKNRADAYNRYISGIVDKVDYKQATISLNNSLSQLKNASEAIQAKYAGLKQLMGYPSDKKFTVHFDTAQMMQEIFADTLAALQFEKRIEYQELQTAKRIQRETTLYYQLGFLPSLSAFYNYNYEFENNEFSDLYSKAYPYSLFGVQLNIPIFTGFRRNENVHKAKLQERRTDWDEVNLKLVIYTQYKQALANYKSNLYYLHAQGENVGMAQEVYNIVRLQYREGVKAYLDVIVAESDLKTSEINYLNALFQVLESKIDLEKAMGDIPADI